MRRFLGLVLLFVTAPAFAQYARFDGYLTNAMGQAISGAQVYILSQPANPGALTPQATLYGNSTGAGGAIAQPLRTDGGFGHAFAYTVAGTYTVVYISNTTWKASLSRSQSIGGGGGGGGGTPAPPNFSVQFNNSLSGFGGDSSYIFNTTSKLISGNGFNSVYSPNGINLWTDQQAVTAAGTTGSVMLDQLHIAGIIHEP